MAALPNVIPFDLAKSLFLERQRIAEQRGKLREKMLDFYYSNHTGKDEYIKGWGFEDKNALPIWSSRLLRRVVDRRSMVYKKPPDRSLLDRNGAPMESDGYQDFIADHPEFNLRIKLLERMRNLLGNVLYRIAYDEEMQRWYFYVETDFIPEYGPANSLYPVAYDIPIKQDTDGKTMPEEIFLHISDTEYYFHDGKGAMWPDETFPGNRPFENPYGIMPVIDWSSEPIDDYWEYGAKSLCEVEQQYIISVLNALYGIHFQSHDQPWASGLEPNDLPKDKWGNPQFKVGTDQLLTVPEGGSVGLLNFSPKLMETANFLLFWLNVELSHWGMRADFAEAGNPASGFALMVKNLELLEAREGDIQLYVPKEKQMYRVIAAINRVHSLGYGMPEDADVMVDFVEPKFPMNPDEERAQAEWEWKNNLSTPRDYLRKRNPDLTDEQAEEQIQANQEFNNVNRSRGVGVFNAIAEEAAEA